MGKSKKQTVSDKIQSVMESKEDSTVSVQELIEKFKGEAAPTTIQVTVGRMADKGIIKWVKKGVYRLNTLEIIKTGHLSRPVPPPPQFPPRPDYTDLPITARPNLSVLDIDLRGRRQLPDLENARVLNDYITQYGGKKAFLEVIDRIRNLLS